MILADPIPDAGNCAIADLSDDERLMLREMAERLRDRKTRSLVARRSLDHVAFLLARAAESEAHR